MSMVYGFVKRNEGYIKLYSEPGMGTTITMYFPRAKTGDTQQQIKQSGEVIEVRGQDETILIVEDEKSLRQLAVELLSAQGYNTIQAENGDAAIDILRSDEYIDLLFCDIVMPGGMNGYQVAEKARELRPHLKIQLTSGLADQSQSNMHEAGLKLNVLQKPYSRLDLINCIEQIFSK